MFIKRRPVISLVLLAAILFAFYLATQKQTIDTLQLIHQQPVTNTLQGDWQFTAASDLRSRMVHAASMVELPNGKLRGFWFAGSREGAKDISINTAVFDPSTGQWGEETVAITRDGLSQQWQHYVRKLGNAVPVIDDNGRLRLFVVAVTFGGWAASRIVALNSDDLGETWQFDTELKTSPFLNISTLAKTPALHYQDNLIGLPVYHEFLGKFGEILFIDPQNKLIDKSRIGYGRNVLQPLVLAGENNKLNAYLRPHEKGFAYQSQSDDAGKTWQTVKKTPIENPGAALGGIALSDKHWLLANNCDNEERDVLCILESLDAGETWRNRWLIHDDEAVRGSNLNYADFRARIDAQIWQDSAINPAELERSLNEKACRHGQYCSFIFDYPYMLQSRNGDLHLLYTWNKVFIRHAWLKNTVTEGAAQ